MSTYIFQDCDAHFFAGCLKSYLRELPVPLLGRKHDSVYDRWIKVVSLNSREAKIREIRYILKEELPSKVVVNIQYMVKFLSEITGKCKINKMTPGNLGIVLGPTLLRQSGSAAASELVNTDKVIKVISILVENYNEIFPVDISWSQYDDDMNDIIAKVRNMYTVHSAHSGNYRNLLSHSFGKNLVKVTVLLKKLLNK